MIDSLILVFLTRHPIQKNIVEVIHSVIAEGENCSTYLSTVSRSGFIQQYPRIELITKLINNIYLANIPWQFTPPRMVRVGGQIFEKGKKDSVSITGSDTHACFELENSQILPD